jgi:adenine/guanine phosphoribosyltransferase-like PRPP-binding protein
VVDGGDTVLCVASRGIVSGISLARKNRQLTGG